MIINTYNFFFHPLSFDQSKTKQIASIITVISMSVFTKGIFLLAFGILNLHEYHISIMKQMSNVKMSLFILFKELSEDTLFNHSTINYVIINFAAINQINMDTSNLGQPSESSASSIDNFKNNIPDLEKINKIKERQKEQLKTFEKNAAENKWSEIHNAHYDWWMFPVHRPSSYGFEFSVNEAEIELLKLDSKFMQNYLRGVELVVMAWGWDLKNDCTIVSSVDPKISGQGWDGYGVRLAKMSDSLRLFGELQWHEKLKRFYRQHCLPQKDIIKILDFDWVDATLSDDPNYKVAK